MFKIGTFDFDYSIYVKQCASRNLRIRRSCTDLGIVGEILHTILHRLNMPYQLIPIPKPEDGKLWGGPVNGTWCPPEAPLAMLAAGKFDMVANLAYQSSDRLEYFASTYPVFSFYLALYARIAQPDITTSFWLLFDVFDTQTWLVLLLLLCLYPIVRCFYNRFVLNKCLGAKAFFLFLLLTLVIFSNLFGAVLLAKLLSPSKTMVDDGDHLIDLIKSKKISLMVNNDSGIFDDELQQSTSPLFVKLRQALMNNPVRYGWQIWMV